MPTAMKTTALTKMALLKVRRALLNLTCPGVRADTLVETAVGWT
jgi:hypothetical protein